jgi:hypothetical protein
MSDNQGIVGYGEAADAAGADVDVASAPKKRRLGLSRDAESVAGPSSPCMAVVPYTGEGNVMKSAGSDEEAVKEKVETTMVVGKKVEVEGADKDCQETRSKTNTGVTAR